MQLLKPSWVSADGHALMSIDVHPDGTRFATGGQGTDCGRVCIWNLKPILDAEAAKDKSVHKLLTQMDHHLGCVNVVRWSNDGRFLASAGDDKIIMIWQKSAFSGGSIFGGGGKVHVEHWRLHQTLRGHNGDVLDLAWGPGDVVLATASVDNSIIIWNAERLPEQITILRGHTSLVKGVFFDPVGKYLASQSDDKTMRVWKTSDWSLETVVDAPFQESGATTHVLRPGWSPDGSIIVSAHAMNGGGPTAQIVERGTWKANRDFVGHKKAVSCARFCGKVFDKVNKESGKNEMYVVVALGSRDRSFSVWTTSLKRPFFVINDAFDQGVLDMSWSRDGKLLLACSMDGSVAAVILTSKEIGNPIPDSKLYEIMRETYGKNFGTIANLKSASMTNGGPVVIENPEMLKRDAVKNTNGHDLSRSNSTSTSKPRLHPQGPTDKQIEARTSDGRRRITPIFIPMSSIENGTSAGSGAGPSTFGITEFGSTSTKERSKISVEKRNDIVKPNISPNKQGNSTSSNDSPPVSASVTPKTTPPATSTNATIKKADQKKPEGQEPKVNILQAKKKPSAGTLTTTSGNEPPVNIIKVKKKPGPSSSPPKQQSQPPQPAPASPPATGKKRKRIAVLSDSSAENSSESESSMDVDEAQLLKAEASMPIKKVTGEENKKEDTAKVGKLKDAKVKKPELMSTKQNVESSPKRPRGRPPMSREYSTNDLNQQHSPPAASTSARSAPAQSDPNQVTKSTPAFKLPSLKMSKCKVYNFSMKQEAKVTITVNNCTNSTKVHDVKCTSDKYNWTALFSSQIVTVGASKVVIVVVCKNGSLHMFSPGDRGQRLFPPLQLPSQVSKLAFDTNQLALVTSCGHLYLWSLDLPRPAIKMAKENVQSLFENGQFVAKIVFSPTVSPCGIILVTSAGRSFTFDHSLGCWLCLTDACGSIQQSSSYATCNTTGNNLNKSAQNDNLPLASLMYLTPNQTPRLQNNVPAETKALANVTHCRNLRLAAEYLNSPKEYQYWLLAEIKQMATNGDVDGIRTTFDWLMGPVHSGTTGLPGSELIMGHLDKRDLLRAGLDSIKGNLDLQRIYIEYNDQLKSSDEVCDLDKLLHV